MSARAATCALCDHVIDASRLTAESASPAAGGGPASGGVARLARAVAIALGIGVLVVTAGAVAVASWLAGDARERAERESRDAGVTAVRLRASWPLIDASARRASRPVRAPARTAATQDRAPLRELLALLASPRAMQGRDSVWVMAMDVDTAAWTRHGRPQLRRMPAGDHAGQVIRAASAARLSAEARARLADDTVKAAAWLGVWRRAAALPEPPAAWQYRVGVPGVAAPVVAPQVGTAMFKSVGWGNAAASLLALDGGDPTSAVHRARENVAMAHLMARSPTMLGWLVGRVHLRESAALLAHVGRHAGDARAVADAAALTRALDGVLALRYRRGPVREARDPRAPALVAAAGDTALPPGVRVASALGIVDGSCLSAREILMGPSGARAAALREAASRLQDVDPEGRLRPLVERALDEWQGMTADGGAIMDGWDQTPPWATALVYAGLGGVAGRGVACALL